MAHPMRKEASDSSTAKFKRMTAHYGAADPKMYKDAPREKSNGPQDAVGYGEGSAPKARSDRKARAANPIATYRKGGKVKHRDSGGDVSAIETANRDQAMASRARGGRMKSKGTHVNVIVAPQSGNSPMTPPAGLLPPGGNPALPPAAPPPMAGAGGPGPTPPMMPPPGAVPPGMMPPRKRGGKVSHPDEAEDRAMIKGMVKSSALKHRASGGKIHMTAGAESGPGRLEKAAARRKNARHESPQEV